MQDALSPRTSVFLSDVETDTWPPDTVQQLAAQSDRWLVTRGEFGAHEFTVDKGMSLVEPVKVQRFLGRNKLNFSIRMSLRQSMLAQKYSCSQNAGLGAHACMK